MYMQQEAATFRNLTYRQKTYNYITHNQWSGDVAIQTLNIAGSDTDQWKCNVDTACR